jgi:predicted XRE-type DNA-binding protein
MTKGSAGVKTTSTLGNPRARGMEAVIKAQLITALVREVAKRKITHAALAKEAGVPRSAVTGILSGSLQKVTIDRVIRLLEAANLPVQVRVAGRHIDLGTDSWGPPPPSSPQDATPQDDEAAVEAAVPWWTRCTPVQAAAEVVVEFAVALHEEPVWQRVEGEARRLRALGMTLQAIGRALGVDEKTVRNVLAR